MFTQSFSMTTVEVNFTSAKVFRLDWLKAAALGYLCTVSKWKKKKTYIDTP